MKDWKEWLSQQKKYELGTVLKDVNSRIRGEGVKKENIRPDPSNIFRAFTLTPLNEVMVVMLGQDPYPQPGVADGLAFSTPKKDTPETLKVVFKEITNDLELDLHSPTKFETNQLNWWAAQGVLLVNSALTVRTGFSNSHAKIWKPFTVKLIRFLNEIQRPIVFILWGSDAKSYKELITNAIVEQTGDYQEDFFNSNKPRHLVLEAAHPVAESRGSGGFYGCKHFSKCNSFIEENYGVKNYIDWGTYHDENWPLPKELLGRPKHKSDQQ